MPLRTSLFLVVLSAAAHAGLPQEIWPLQPVPAAIVARLAAGKSLEPELWPAVEFQQVFCEILTGAPPAKWQAQLGKFLNPAPNDFVAQGIADVARIWLARARMLEVDVVLKKYYRRAVSFPESLAAVMADLPAQLRTDPWGQPWVYTVHAPEGFARQANQRYQLGPTRCPLLTTLREATKPRPAQAVPWKITAHSVSGERSLQFKGKKTSALIQQGGSVDGYALLYIGDNWALLAAQDQLFAVTF
ncbi:MAG: hypothetical protein PCFJNLEI_00780 [Verrucomicrobiae bacterium]|nr:hypothetical protein [Verrucomicrobiae bacterium]